MTDLIPLWALLGLCAALIQTAIPLIQENRKADGFSLAVIIKLVSAFVMLPVVLFQGFPINPTFYLSVGFTSLLWAISDVIYFNAVPKVGAGVVSRLLPSAVLISFVLWFFFDPALLHTYLEKPNHFIAVCFIILLSAIFAFQIKKCPVSWQGVRLLWFVIFAACIGPLLEKITLGHAPSKQAPYAFVFIQSCFMLFFWLVYFIWKKPASWQTLTSSLSLKTGTLIGLCSVTMVTLRFIALQEVEHPAYLSIILFTDALWIVFIHRLIGKKDNSNIWAGMGIVFCAIALAFVKSPVFDTLF